MKQPNKDKQIDEQWLMERATATAQKALVIIMPDIIKAHESQDVDAYIRIIEAILTSMFMSGAMGLYLMQEEGELDFSPLKKSKAYKEGVKRYQKEFGKGEISGSE